ncbi:MAG: HNH endonuclease [Pseudomonadota bacterium]|nr:HNH endonuclease [Pseudomonadota bacterium]
MTVQRLRGRANQEQRKRCWLSSPCCARCGLITAFPSGFELDHITALINGGTNDDSNMQVLHIACHEAKTNEDLGYTPKVATGIDGWPVEADPDRSATARWKRVERSK